MADDLSWSIGHNGVLEGFAYHDGLVVRLCYRGKDVTKYNAGNNVAMTVRNSERKLVEIRFCDVSRMNIAEFLPTPILNTIDVHRNSSVDGHFPFEDEFWKLLLSPAPPGIEDFHVSEVVRLRASAHDRYFVNISGTFGLQLAAICRTIKVCLVHDISEAGC